MSKSFLLLALLVVVSESQRDLASKQRCADDGRGAAATADAGAKSHHARG